MKVTLESTDRLVTLNGVPARIWEGETESGIKCHAFVTRIAVHEDDDSSQFDRELQQHRVPSEEIATAYAVDARLLL